MADQKRTMIGKMIYRYGVIIAKIGRVPIGRDGL